MRGNLVERIEDLIEPVLRSMGIELVEIELKRGPSRSLLRLTIDQEGGVSVEDCARVSRETEALLDVEDLVPGSYTLEVSSPGLDRPLKTLGDFRRFTGFLTRLNLVEPVDGQRQLIGRIVEIDGDRIGLDLEGSTVWIPYAHVRKARLEVEF